MSRFKVLLISFFVVFVIFALLAFFTGSSLPWSLFKALVSACLAVAFVLLANFFLLKYIPDFFEDKSKEEGLDDNVVGANLDIRINDVPTDSSEHVTEEVSPQVDASFSNLGSADFEAGIQDDSLAKENDLHEDSLPSPDLLSSENLSDEKKEGDVPSNSSAVDNTQKTALEVNAGVHMDDAELSEAELSQTIEKDVDRLEELPDLQEFVDSSNLQGEQSRGDELMNTGTQSFFATDLSEDVTDTNLMAKAVRTVLKREI